MCGTRLVWCFIVSRKLLPAWLKEWGTILEGSLLPMSNNLSCLQEYPCPHRRYHCPRKWFQHSCKVQVQYCIFQSLWTLWGHSPGQALHQSSCECHVQFDAKFIKYHCHHGVKYCLMNLPYWRVCSNIIWNRKKICEKNELNSLFAKVVDIVYSKFHFILKPDTVS